MNDQEIRINVSAGSHILVYVDEERRPRVEGWRRIAERQVSIMEIDDAGRTNRGLRHRDGTGQRCRGPARGKGRARTMVGSDRSRVPGLRCGGCSGPPAARRRRRDSAP